jgi:ABC-type transporter Mla MlaB component
LAGLEEPPAPLVRALSPHPEPNTIVLVFEDPLGRASVGPLCERLRVLLESCDADQVVCDVSALVDPDAASVDALARLQLTARRLGREIRLRHACGELQDLLSLMGLGDVVSLCAESGLEPGGQTEQWEQGLGVQEEANPADPAG